MARRRSIDSQVIASIEGAVGTQRADLAGILERARELRRRTADAGLPVADLIAAQARAEPGGTEGRRALKGGQVWQTYPAQ